MCKEGELFSKDLQKEIKEKFYFLDKDHKGESRLFFDNAGGSFRLKKSLEKFQEIEAIPNCPERIHKDSLYLIDIMEKGIEDIRMIFNASKGSIFMSLTASQVIFNVTRIICENVPGNNVVTTSLEHPSAYDACKVYSKKTGKELRVAKSNPKTGGVDVEEIISLIDEDTSLLSVIYASNISGSILDIKNIVKRAREIKPDLYIICDAVQHVPHSRIDVDELKLDSINFAPYKFFGIRGSGIGYVSDRVSELLHDKLIAKPQDEWNLGSPSPAHYASISEIVDYISWIGSKHTQTESRLELYNKGMEKLMLHERALLSRLLNGSDEVEGLRNMKGVRVLLDNPNLETRDLIIGIEVEGLDFTKAVKKYEDKNVIVYERVNTSLYSKRIVESLGIEGAIRISPLHCHGIEDIDEFLKITKEIISEI